MSIPNGPIGIFDSGLGGLTVLRQVQRLLPEESILYDADTANVPYGDKPLHVVRDLALRLTEHLIRSGAKLIIMASGTSTAAGLEAARAAFPETPILGTIEAGARAAAAQAGPIGVLATAGTAHSRAFTQAVHRVDPSHTVLEIGCPLFVPLVESGRAGTSEAVAAARVYLAPLLDANARTIILGCTHFPFLLPALGQALRDISHPPVFVDPAEQTVLEAAQILASAGLCAPSENRPSLQFAATGDPADFSRRASALLEQDLPPASPLDFAKIGMRTAYSLG